MCVCVRESHSARVRVFIRLLGDYASNLNSAKARRRVILRVSQRLKQYFTGSAGEIKVPGERAETSLIS